MAPLCSPGCASIVNGTRCGFRTNVDCPIPFSFAQLISQNEISMSTAINLANRANLECKKTFTSKSSGSWCGGYHKMYVQKKYAHAVAEIVGPDAHVVDVGAGFGQLGRTWRKMNISNRYTAYDGGAHNISDVHIKYVDLSIPWPLVVGDFVISTEVGEHIPREKEMEYIYNLHTHNKKGVIISWAGLNQGGYGHVNTHSMQYVINIFNELGYNRRQNSLTHKLSEYNGNILVFDRLIHFKNLKKHTA